MGLTLPLLWRLRASLYFVFSSWWLVTKYQESWLPMSYSQYRTHNKKKKKKTITGRISIIFIVSRGLHCVDIRMRDDEESGDHRQHLCSMSYGHWFMPFLTHQSNWIGREWEQRWSRWIIRTCQSYNFTEYVLSRSFPNRDIFRRWNTFPWLARLWTELDVGLCYFSIYVI